MAHTCSTCNKSFDTKQGIRAHCRAKEHKEDVPCGEVSKRGQTIQTGGKISCNVCQSQFISLAELEKHLNAVHHTIDPAIVETGHLAFKQGSSSSSSNTRGTSVPNLKCGICGKVFKQEGALKSHAASRAKAHMIWKCDKKPCTEAFFTGAALDKHKRKKHASTNTAPQAQRASNEVNIRTPVTPTPPASAFQHAEGPFECVLCAGTFELPSAVAHHLESGCHEHLNRHHVTVAVKSLKVIPQITVAPIDQQVLPPPPLIVHTATPSSWDGSAFKCFLCPKTFESLVRLEAHLNSPAHDAKEFKCPKCKKKFILISALVQHLESLACGLTQSEEIVGFYSGLVAKFSSKLLPSAA
ncbi:hypothetical protein CPC08DRAFT_823720 [Agrocybe pediades]|nr:hypothetical protein CPC08DRAFT_823720 [Agrocybe pediades]